MSLAELIRGEARAAALGLNVLRPARVEEYDAERELVTVQPLLMPVHADAGEEKALVPPKLEGVPVWWPRWGGFRVIGELVPGDVVGLVFVDRSLDPVLAQTITDAVPAQPVDPKDARAHDLSDAIAIPGIIPTAVGQAATAPVVLRHLSGLLDISIGPDGSVGFGLGGQAAGQPMVRGTALAGFLALLDTWARTHTHVAPPLGGPTAVAVPPPPQLPGDLLAALIRIP